MEIIGRLSQSVLHLWTRWRVKWLNRRAVRDLLKGQPQKAAGPGSVERLKELADVLVVNGRTREAADLLERALSLGRSDSSAEPGLVQEALDVLTLAFLYMMPQLGDLGRAEILIREADVLLQRAAQNESLPSSPEARMKRYLSMAGEMNAKTRALINKVSVQGWSQELAVEASRDMASSLSPLAIGEARFILAQTALQVDLGQEPDLLDYPDDDSESAFESSFGMDGDDADLDQKQMTDMMRSLDFALPINDRHLDTLIKNPEYYSPGAAESMLRTAIERRVAVLGESHPETAYARYKLAEYLDRHGESGEIEHLLRKAVEAWKPRVAGGDPFHVDYLPALRALACLCGSTDRAEEAWPLLLEATGIEDRLIANFLSFTSEEQRRSFLGDLREAYYWSLSIAWKLAGRSPEVTREAFALVLRRKGLLSRAQLAQWKLSLRAEDPCLASRIEELAAVRQRIADRLLAGGDPEQDEDLAVLTGRREKLEAGLAREVAGSSLGQQIGPVGLEAFCQALPPDSVLIEIVSAGIDFEGTFRVSEGDMHYLAFVLPASDLDGLRVIDLGDSIDIDFAIHTFRQEIADRSEASRDISSPPLPPSLDDGSSAAWLRRYVVGPILDLAGGRKVLLISPDRDLSFLPFEVLPDGEGKYLIDHYSVSYLSSARELLRWGAEPAREPSPPVVIADPSYDLGLSSAPEAPVFRRLLHGAAEGGQVARFLGVEPTTGDQAVEARLRELRSPHILHLATHGFLIESLLFESRADLPERLRGRDMADPLLSSGLALAGANTWLQHGQPPAEAGDGLLTAAEVAMLHLVDTELVVLSACKTGVGQVHAGEGIMGLRSSFAIAGAHTLVMSLWEVPDRGTRELMALFYTYLREGKGRAEALRRAQLDLKEQDYSPRAWGAFICQGNPGPLIRPLGGLR